MNPAFALVDADNSSRALEHPDRPLDILFLGFQASEIDGILSLLRSGKLSPRGRSISGQKTLLEALQQRTWDLLLYNSSGKHEPSPERLSSLLQDLNRDIPLILIAQESGAEAQLEAFRAGAQALLSLQPAELLLHGVLQQLQELDTRRRLRLCEALLDTTERHLHEQVVNSNTAIGYLDQGRLCFANKSLLKLMGCQSLEPLTGGDFALLLAPEQRPQITRQIHALLEQHSPVDTTLELSLIRADRSAFSTRARLQNCRYRGKNCLSITLLPDQKASEGGRKVDDLATLGDASVLLERLDEATQRALNGGHDAQLIHIRLDQYDQIREQYDQEAVDGLLLRLARALQQKFRPPHLVCQPEAGSFAILFHHANSEATLQLGRKLAASLKKLEQQTPQGCLSTTVSIGITAITETAPPASEMLNRARQAAEEIGGDGCALYHAPGRVTSSAKREAVKRILQAICDHRLKLLFQPMVALDDTSQRHCYEVLVRLQDENDAMLLPATFMTEVMQSDVMVRMDRWVLERAIQLLKEKGEEAQDNQLFLNLSGRSLSSQSLLSWFGAQIKELQIPPARIVIQVSETDAATRLEAAIHFATTIRTLGCGLCLKHFGSSPSARRVVQELQPDFLKLDGTWVQDLAKGKLTPGELSALLEEPLAEGRMVIAPQVENSRVIARLFQCGIRMIQGYYLQQPEETMDYGYFGDP